jgi:hypothetical protein
MLQGRRVFCLFFVELLLLETHLPLVLRVSLGFLLPLMTLLCYRISAASEAAKEAAVSLHSSPRPAPHVGQLTVCTCLGLGFLAFMVINDGSTPLQKRGHSEQKLGEVCKIMISRGRT